MKLSSKKLLLWLYPVVPSDSAIDAATKAAEAAKVAARRRRVSYTQIEILLSDLTEAGRQSLLRLLENKDLLFTDKLRGQLNASISSYGQSQLEAQFPVLKQATNPWQGTWSMIVFLESPPADDSFRYLRSLLLKEHCFALKRGVYLHPGQLSVHVMELLQTTYRNAVIIVQFDNWEFGDDRKIIGQKTNLMGLVDIYSGISTELNNMLNKKLSCKTLTSQQKKAIYSVYHRLVSNLETDSGIVNYYFPQVEDGLQLLNKLKMNLT